jgi:hypothetical protein
MKRVCLGTCTTSFCRGHGIIAVAFSLATTLIFNASLIAQENPGVPWSATDALGRSLPMATEAGAGEAGSFCPRLGLKVRPCQSS